MFVSNNHTASMTEYHSFQCLKFINQLLYIKATSNYCYITSKDVLLLPQSRSADKNRILTTFSSHICPGETLWTSASPSCRSSRPSLGRTHRAKSSCRPEHTHFHQRAVKICDNLEGHAATGWFRCLTAAANIVLHSVSKKKHQTDFLISDSHPVWVWLESECCKYWCLWFTTGRITLQWMMWRKSWMAHASPDIILDSHTHTHTCASRPTESW